MSTPKSGDAVQVAIGCEWFDCVVLSVVDTPHWSGQVIKCFTVLFPEGDKMPCGRNSVQHRLTGNTTSGNVLKAEKAIAQLKERAK